MRDNLHCCHFRSDQLARSDQLVRCSSDQLVRWIFFGKIIARRGLGCRVAFFHGAGVRVNSLFESTEKNHARFFLHFSMGPA